MIPQDLEGLCNSDYFTRNRINDYWSITSRNHRKQLVTWNSVSASQIETFSKCKRAWYFKSVLRIPEPQRGPQALGESVHLFAEKIPKGLTAPVRSDTQASPEEWEKATKLAEVLLPLIPTDEEFHKIKREWGFRMPTYPGGPVMTGYIDIAIAPGYGWPAFIIPANEAVIGDYKTLSDFRYMKTPEELANNIQLMTYAKWAIQEWPSGLVGEHDPIPEFVRLVHVYAKTRGPFSRSSIRNESALVTVPQINSFWEKTLDTVREMEQIANTQACTADDVEAGGALNGHCEAYGGCFFRDRCGISKESSIKTVFQITKKPQQETTPDMSGSAMLQKIQAARAAAGLAPTPQQATVTEAATLSPDVKEPVKPTGPISGLLAKIEAQNKGRPQLGGAVAQAYGKEIGSTAHGFAGTGELGVSQVSTVGELVKLASGVVPPDAPSRRQEVITKPGDAVTDPEAEPAATESEDAEDEETGSVDSTSNNTSAPGVVSNSVSASISQAVETGPKRRGRPSKDEMAAKQAAEQARFDAAVAAEVEKRLAQVGVNVTRIEVPADQDPDKFISEITASYEKKVKDLEAAVQKEREIANQALVDAHDAKKTMSNQTGCTLYIDCYPTKGDKEGLVDFFDWIQPIAAAVAESNKVQDYRLIQYNSKGLLATAIRELVKAEGLPRCLTLPTYAAGADVALEILSPLAKRVIRKLA